MRIIIINLLWTFLTSTMSIASADDQWFCREESGKRSGRFIWACGVGEGAGEGAARKEALREAVVEYRAICEMSADCAEKRAHVEGKRLTCAQDKITRLWKCYRLIAVEILD